MRENSNESELIDRVVARLYIYIYVCREKKIKNGKYRIAMVIRCKWIYVSKKQNNQTNRDWT